MAEFMTELLTDPRRRRSAETHILNSLCVFEQEASCPDLLLHDPAFIDRWVLLLRCALDFVPRKRPWVKAKILLWRMERIAHETRDMRTRLICAHGYHTAGMAMRSDPPDVSSRCFPN